MQGQTGPDIHLGSEKWERVSPLPAQDGHELLQTLEASLERREREMRELGFEQAHAAVDRAKEEGGVPRDGRYPFSKSYPHPPRDDDRRVDIEVKAGLAFVP